MFQYLLIVNMFSSYNKVILIGYIKKRILRSIKNKKLIYSNEQVFIAKHFSLIINSYNYSNELKLLN